MKKIYENKQSISDPAKGKSEHLGFQYKSRIEIFGLPLLHISFCLLYTSPSPRD